RDAGVQAAVELDQEHGVVSDGERVGARARLGVAVDRDLLREGEVARRRPDRVDSPSRDVEVDDVRAGAQPVLLDGRPERARPRYRVADSVAGIVVVLVPRAVDDEGRGT